MDNEQGLAFLCVDPHKLVIIREQPLIAASVGYVSIQVQTCISNDFIQCSSSHVICSFWHFYIEYFIRGEALLENQVTVAQEKMGCVVQIF